MDDGPKYKARLLGDVIADCVSHGITDKATGEMVGTGARTFRRRRQSPAVVDQVAQFVAEPV